MSPEQIEQPETVDSRADVYGLGAVLYELLTGQIPFPREQAERKLTDETPRPPRELNPRIPEDLNAITLCCLQYDRRRRYQSAAALADDLQSFLEGKPV